MINPKVSPVDTTTHSSGLLTFFFFFYSLCSKKIKILTLLLFILSARIDALQTGENCDMMPLIG